MTSSEIGICISIVVYLSAMVVIGYFCSKKNNDSGDFYLGGRKLGPLVTAMSAEASDMSGWLLMGLPGVALLIKGFSYGSIAEAVWTALGLALGTYVNWLIVAKKLRRYSEAAGNSLTVPEFFSNRFGDKGNILRAIGAVIIIVFFIPYTASGFSACGKLFTSLFSLDYLPSMIVSAIVIVLYTTMGGFLAASTTDFIQSIIMTGALAIILGYGIVHGGGIGEIISNAKAVPGYFSLVSQVSADGAVSSYNGLTIASTLAWGLGYFGMPHILLRFMAIEDEKKLKLSRRIASIWVIIAMFIAISIGIIGYSLVTNGTVADITDGETIIVKIAGVISESGFIPALIAGLILAGILASTMSTADSQLLAAASSISEDIVQGLFKIKLSKKAAMIIARVTVIVISLIGMFIARDANSSVFNIVSFAWAGFGASFGPLVLFALFWRRSNKWGALAGMISGGVMVFVWKYLVRPLGGLLDIYELLPAFIVSCIFIVVVSLLTKAPDKEITDVFDRVSK